MKPLLFLVLMIFSLFGFAMTTEAQNTAYHQAMDKAMSELKQAKTASDLVGISNQFGRIAAREKDNWLPLYWQAYTQLIAAFWSNDDKDLRNQYTDTAEKLIEQLLLMKPKESEILTLKGYLYQAKLSANPMLGPVYGPKCSAVLEEAIRLEPSNPRAHFLLGQNTFFTPVMFGGGKDKARPPLEKAVQLYQLESIDPATFMPFWGKSRCEALLKECI